MKETTGNIWNEINKADVICITTNGTIYNDRLVMNEGIAKYAKERYPGIDIDLAEKVKEFGNRPFVCARQGLTYIASFPTKNDWRDPSDFFLIRASAIHLVDMANHKNWKRLVLPKPECEFGGLGWRDVRNVLAPIFDDRFTVYDY